MAIAATKPIIRNPVSDISPDGNSLAVVTGASSGIGFELARRFIDAGYDLIIAAEDPGIHTAAERLKRNDLSVRAVQVDLSNYEGVETLYNAIKMDGRAVEAIAINAGVGVSGDFTEDTPLHDELKMIGLNVSSAVHLAKRVARDMVTNGQGRILFTSSIAAAMPSPYLAVYGATKAFLFSFSEALRNELKDKGVTVTALLPEPTDTHFFDRAGMQNTKAGQGRKSDPADIALQGFEAMMAGKDHVIGGSLKGHIQGALAGILPETLKAEMSRRQLRPGSGDHRSH